MQISTVLRLGGGFSKMLVLSCVFACNHTDTVTGNEESATDSGESPTAGSTDESAIDDTMETIGDGDGDGDDDGDGDGDDDDDGDDPSCTPGTENCSCADDVNQCTEALVCQEGLCLPLCGDGALHVASGEECDDGNAVDFDACINCQSATCGDGVRSIATEQCDDGNDDDFDTCRNDCRRNRVLAIGVHHTCYLRDGEVWCWGQGAGGAAGYGVGTAFGFTTPLDQIDGYGPVDLGGDVLSISSRNLHTCALRADGSVVCWGAASLGQLGYGNTAVIGDDEVPGMMTVGLGNNIAVDVAVGWESSCALLDHGDVICWGNHQYGAIGPGHLEPVGNGESPFPSGTVVLPDGVRTLDVGGLHACVLLENGSVHCWGHNAHGNLGQGSTEIPINFAGDDVVDIVAGGHHTCALLSDGGLRCWGRGLYGQLGLGSTMDIGDDEPPAAVDPVELPAAVIDLSTGYYQTCVRLATPNEDMICWGDNGAGQLGYGHLTMLGDNEPVLDLPPVDFGGALVAHKIGLEHACALLTGGELRCWGLNTYGELGLGHNAFVLGPFLPVPLP